jgi:hypothetical protein
MSYFCNQPRREGSQEDVISRHNFMSFKLIAEMMNGKSKMRKNIFKNLNPRT